MSPRKAPESDEDPGWRTGSGEAIDPPPRPKKKPQRGRKRPTKEKPPKEPPDPSNHPTCIAHKTNGDPCNAHPIKGGAVCRVHGGSAPQVREKARLRLLANLDPASAELVRIALQGEDEKTRVQAIRQIMDRGGLPAESRLGLEGSLELTVAGESRRRLREVFPLATDEVEAGGGGPRVLRETKGKKKSGSKKEKQEEE